MNKFFISSLLTVLCAPGAQAVPVLNENAAVSQECTIFPDHADPTLFYIAPNSLTICLDGRNIPLFLYQDLRTKNGTHGIVQTTFCARYNQPELEASKKALLARNPKARFTALPFVSSQIKFSTTLAPLVTKESCTHPAGMVGDVESCSFQLNSIGRRVFIRQVHERLAMAMQYEYTVAGFIRSPDGRYISRDTTFGVAALIGGEELKVHPELFSDADGNTLVVKR
jgi:hypothetical protein